MAYKKWASIEERFWSKVDIKEDPKECWLWTAMAMKSGYGSFMLKIKDKWQPVPAHRVSYELTFGPIPDGFHIDHAECQRTTCVNPYHLEAVTQAENNRRMNLRRNNLGQMMSRDSVEFIKPLQTHCGKGHPFTQENTYVRPNGKRECRMCRIIREKLAEGEINGDVE